MRTVGIVTIGILGWAASSARTAGAAESPRDRASVVVERIRRADYAGDRAALKDLRAELEPFAADPAIASRIRYWQGFALWRRAFNGFNDAATPKDLADDLTAATADFDAALALDPRFSDAQIGAISCLSNLVFLDRQDAAQVQEWLKRVGPRVEDVKKTDPDNPRFQWVMGANRWYAPPERGGGEAPAMAMYQRGLDEARKRTGRVDDPLEPSWGEPELLMNLAWANLHKTAPDPAAAERFAQSALAIVPYWHYVRDILLVQIREAKSKGAGMARDLPPAPGNSLEDFGFVVGSWTGTVRGHATGRLPNSFESPGRMDARWGPGRAWIDCESTTEIPGLGSYAVKVLVSFDARTGAFDSFAVNTAGTRARYSGKRQGDTFVFIGQVGAVVQRVTYRMRSPRELLFTVEESADGGASYRPHSETLWTRS